MGELLDAVITAHGGLDRWNAVRSVDVKQPRAWSYSGLAVIRTIAGFSQRTACGSRTSRRLVRRGAIRPRAAFAGHVRETPWDRLHLTYFLGYALWNYLTAPFLFAWQGFNYQELDPACRRPGDMARARSDLPGQHPSAHQDAKALFR
jgi:hypothetical protein